MAEVGKQRKKKILYDKLESKSTQSMREERARKSESDFRKYIVHGEQRSM